MNGHRLPLRSAAIGLLAAAVLPGVASAHPLGNFTINHYAGIRVSRATVAIDLVIDEAEIPTFQERQRLDTNGDGTVSPAEVEAERQVACGRLSQSIDLTFDGRPLALSVGAAGISFLPGAGGLFTMRTVCELSAALPRAVAASDALAFADRSFEARIGWREIVAQGDGVTVGDGNVSGTSGSASVSGRLTHYPSDLLSQPLDVRSVTVTLAEGGHPLPPFVPPDAWPLDRGPLRTPAAPSSALAAAATVAGAIPGGVGSDLAGLLSDRDVTLPVLVLSLLVAAGLGAAHAVSPGHGKTVMAAYLVGSHGTARHAVGLGLVVTLSHTLGVLGLAAITLLAGSLVSPERLYPVLGALSGGSVVAMGGWLLLVRVREMRRSGSRDLHRHAHGQDHDYDHGTDHDHDHGAAHSHGGMTHTHVPAGGGALTWRRLFALGLAGGLVPSASALLLLLGALATGRAAYGLVLVVAFGLGMAFVLSGVGVAMVHATRLVEGLANGRNRGMGQLVRLGRLVPIGTAVAVLVAGLVLTGENLHAVF